MTDPIELAQEISMRIGAVGSEPTIISERRGAATLRLDAPEATRTIKMALRTSDGVEPAVGALANEVAVLQAVPHYFKEFAPVVGILAVDLSPVPYLVKNWLPGQPVKKTLRSSRSSERMDRSVFLSITRASFSQLAYLHRAGWAHGDLQPDHLIGDGVHVHLTDFGCAGLILDDEVSYRGGLVHFNAPEICEQILRKGEARLTFAADVYSLSASLYYATFERLLQPYTAPSDYRATLVLLQQGPAEYVMEDIRRNLGQDVEDLFARLLSTDPRTRFQSAMEVLDGMAALN